MVGLISFAESKPQLISSLPAECDFEATTWETKAHAVCLILANHDILR
jgi:hypothetical protein